MRTLRQLLPSLALLTFAFTAQAADTAVPETLRVGTSAGYAPLTFEKEGRLAGMEIDLANAVGDRLDVPVEFVEVSFEDLIPALVEGKIDVIMSGMSITDERRAQVLFTDPYLDIGQMGMIRVDDLTEWTHPGTLYSGDKVIGVKQGTTGDRFASTKLADSTVRRFDSIEAGIEALQAGEIDIFIHDAPTIWRLSAEYDTWKSGMMGLFTPFTDEQLAWAVRRGDTQLAGALNRALGAIEQDGSLETLRKKWIPVQVKVKQKKEVDEQLRRPRGVEQY